MDTQSQSVVPDPMMPAQPALIRFTPQEIGALRALINIAVKTAGMQVAQAALVLDAKLMKAMETTNASETGPRGRSSGDAQVQARNPSQRKSNGTDRKGPSAGDRDRIE